MTDRRFLLAEALLLVAAVPSKSAAASDLQALTAPGVHEDVTFADYPSIATAPQILSRFLSPLAAQAVRSKLERSGETLRPQMFDIGSEKFLVFVPDRQPPEGYGLLLFVPPWPQEEVPAGWEPILDRHGIIFVTAARSGNSENVLERRVPLALAALANVQSHFKVDPSRIFVGGFSGGSRVALRMALSYPDLFSGALLNAGSDPIGESPSHLPSTSLLLKFQEGTRLVYVTGANDPGSLSLDASSLSSMHHWCVANVSVRNDRNVGHEAASPEALDWALGTMSAAPRNDEPRMAACRDQRLSEVRAALEAARAAVDAGRGDEARSMLLKIDRRYGALAEPDLSELAKRCACSILEQVPG
jgi:predicted esterase